MSIKVTLAAAEALDRAGGGIYGVAEALLLGDMQLVEIRRLLQTAFGSGYRPTAPRDSLARTLTEIIGPLQRIGAVRESAEGRSIDFQLIRQFCLGILHWTPEATESAEINAIADAWCGFALMHNIRPAQKPGQLFLEEMMRRFPDHGAR